MSRHHFRESQPTFQFVPYSLTAALSLCYIPCLAEFLFLALDSREIRQIIREKVYARLRKAIVEGYFAPGERLVQDKLAEQLGVSRSPVREAIRRLESEGLVEVTPVRRVTVINMPLDEAVGLYDLREVLEGLAARLAARNITPDQLSGLRDCVRRMEGLLPPKTTPHRWVEENSRFHEIIVQASRNRKLTELLPVLCESIGVLCRAIESNRGGWPKPCASTRPYWRL
ncbi:MAG: GntR family transcriptional regulator [Firmicutes bacterium]|nr:GntR family transcriptional regulator [Bacillota bacterium]